MARPRVKMTSHREILRYVLDLKLSGNETHSILGVSRGKVQNCVKLARNANLTWSQVETLSDEQLTALLFPDGPERKNTAAQLDCEKIYAELQRRGVKLQLLYEEHIEAGGVKISYPQFTRLVKKWAKSRQITMRQDHAPGECLYLDFSGMTAQLTNPETGEVTPAQIFVATFGASNYTYFEALESQKLQDWIEAHIRAFKYFGGLPKFLVPDNLKSAVTDAERFDPILNRTYSRFAAHYGLGVKPARPYKPKDKAKVEKSVQNIEYRVLARLRNRTFLSIRELNSEIALLREELNDAPFQKAEGSRTSWFADIDKPALRPLPAEDFEFEEWIIGYRVPREYHVNVSGHFYSVPYSKAQAVVDVRYTKHIVEILEGNTRIASHVRSWAAGKKTTADEHLAPSHALYKGLSPEFFIKEAEKIGPNTLLVVESLLKAKPYPQLSFSECFGLIKKLKADYGTEELELACIQAIRLQTIGYRVIKNILEAGVKTLPEQLTLRVENIQHENLRGSDNYH